MITVYVKLLDEGTDVWRPTQAEPFGGMIAKLLPTPDYDPQDEHWEFPPKSFVKYESRILGGKRAFVAIGKCEGAAR
jgi:hypothetical protein